MNSQHLSVILCPNPSFSSLLNANSHARLFLHHDFPYETWCFWGFQYPFSHSKTRFLLLLSDFQRATRLLTTVVFHASTSQSCYIPRFFGNQTGLVWPQVMMPTDTPAREKHCIKLLLLFLCSSLLQITLRVVRGDFKLIQEIVPSL